MKTDSDNQYGGMRWGRFRIITFLMVSLLAVSWAMAQGQSASITPGFPELPQEVQATLDDLLSLARKSYDYFLAANPSRYQEANQRFHKLLGDLNKRVGADLFEKVHNFPGQRIEKNLIMIAKDRADHPESYEELVEMYGKWHDHVDGRRVAEPRVRGPMPVRSVHMCEKYRLAWECLLLEPPSAAVGFMQFLDPVVTEALRRIASEGSVPVLVLRCRYRCGKVMRYQGPILETLSIVGSETALLGLLDCVPVPAKGEFLTEDEEVVRDLICMFLAGTAREGEYRLRGHKWSLAANWRRVMAHFPREGLTEEQKEFFDQVKAVQEKNKDLLDQYDSRKK